MLLKGFFRNLGGPVSSSVKGYLELRQRGFEDEVQVVGSIHSTKEVPPMRDGGKGLTGRCIEEGR
jgi:hypothetical protein